MEPLISTGLIKGWFNEFYDYWYNTLGGRPISVMDFHALHFHYRRMYQTIETLNWKTNADHLANWQHPRNFSAVFHLVWAHAMNPIPYYTMLKRFKKGMRVLEFGCSLAPVYRCYREFMAHKKITWVLADIPTHAYHYALYSYHKDADIENMVVIQENMFDNPLKDVDGLFDIIFINTVFEHLQNPLHIARYLHQRLKPGGYLVFDYIKSDARGLDTPKGLEERVPTLQFIERNYDIVEGRIYPLEDSIRFAVGKKKAE